jgi:hypothetical protein
VGSGGNIAIPAARRGASVVGLDITGVEDHVHQAFGAAGVTPSIARETFDLEFASEAEAVDDYTQNFGPFVAARAVLEPQGRWPELLQAVADLVRRFNASTDGSARLPAEFLLITVDR